MSTSEIGATAVLEPAEALSRERPGSLVNVVVCTRDRHDQLKLALESILASTYTNFELLVVDQSATSDTRDLVESMQQTDDRIRYVADPGKGLSRARNIGGSMCTSDVIAFTDDDCTVSETWLARIVEVLSSDPRIGVYFGAVTAPSHDPLHEFIPTYQPASYKVYRGRFILASVIGMGASMAVRRPIAHAVGWFNPLLGAGAPLRSGEDWEIAYRTLKAGYRVVDDPERHVVHWGGREYASGDARRLVMAYVFGHGAGYLLNARSGDVVAGFLFLREAFSVATRVGWNFLRGRKPAGVRQVQHLALGAYRALVSPPVPAMGVGDKGPSQ